MKRVLTRHHRPRAGFVSGCRGRCGWIRQAEARDQRKTTRTNETHQCSSEALYGETSEVDEIRLRNPGHFRGDAADSAVDRREADSREDLRRIEVSHPR